MSTIRIANRHETLHLRCSLESLSCGNVERWTTAVAPVSLRNLIDGQAEAKFWTMRGLILMTSFLSSCQAFVVLGSPWGPTTPQHQQHQHPATTAAMKTSTKTSHEETKIKTRDLLSLTSIRSTLIRQEETIIFALIERAQFRHNLIVYQRGGFGNLGLPLGSTPVDDDTELSFLEYMLVGTVCNKR
jgi:hypothetical protein